MSLKPPYSARIRAHLPLCLPQNAASPSYIRQMKKARFDHAFKKPDYTDWKNRVMAELKDKSFDDYLIWQSLDGFEVDAWQSAPPKICTTPPTNSKPWKIVEPIFEMDAQSANKTALDALNNGAESAYFFKKFLGAAAAVAVKNIDQEIAPIFIPDNTHHDLYKPLLKHAVRPDFSHNRLMLDGARFRNCGAGPLEEAAYLIAQLIETNESADNLEMVLVKTGVGASYLTEIAKIRAMRWIFSSLKSQSTAKFPDIEIMSTNLTRDCAVNDEHTNILRATSSGFAAAVGGANYIMILPWDHHFNIGNRFSARISRNIQLLLKEEAHIDKNLNPADGSYFMENLTSAIAQIIWEKVREISSAGGFTAYATTGALKKHIETSQKVIISQYQKQQRILLGINKYPPSKLVSEPIPKASHYELLPAYMHLPSNLTSTKP